MFKKAFKYFYLYIFFSSFLLFMPVLLLIYTKRNISVTDMLIIEAFYYLAIFLFEVPTGILGDRIGHDKLVVIGLTGTILSYIFFAFSFNILMVIISQVFLGIFGSCVSGSDHGSLYTYIENKGLDNSLKYQNNIYKLSTFSMLLSFIVSGLLFELDPKGMLTFLSTALTYLIGTIFYICFIISKNKNMKSGTEKLKTKKITIKNDLIIDKDIIICGVLMGILSGSYVLSQIFYNKLQIEPSIIGMIYCLGTVTTIILNMLKFNFNKKIMFIMPTMYLVTIINHKIGVLIFIFIVALIKSKIKPFINNYILCNSSSKKAYSMSMMSLVYNIINVIFMVSLSRIINLIGYNKAIIIITIITFFLIIYIYKKSSSKYKSELT